jgi:hypothetical protein
VSDFKNITEVLNHVEGSLVISLLDHVMGLEDKYQDALISPPEGIYLITDIQPIMEIGKTYYPKSRYPQPEALFHATTDIDTLLSLRDDIVDHNGDMVIRHRDLVSRRRYFKTEPTLPVIALKAAIGIVEQYLVSVSRHSRRTHPRYRIDNLVLPGNEHLIECDEFMHAFDRLLDIVTRFVDGDHWNLYHTRIKGSNLIVEKGIDYRILCYYENVFKETEEE